MSTSSKPGPALRGIRLVEGPERGSIELGGTTFHYLRLPHGEMAELRFDHSPRGILDQRAFHEALWKRVLVGWEHLWVGPEGEEEELAFDASEVLRVARALPDAVAEAILSEARAAQFLIQAAVGNSPGSSPSA